jgi:glycine cleavage system H protein
MTPDDRKYTRSHTWIRSEGNLAVLGITDHAQRALGDITFVEMPAIGTKAAAGEPCAIIESVKTASDVCSPVDGEVAEVNTALESNPELISKEPYGKGWILKLRNCGAAAPGSLLDAPGYDAVTQSP